MKSTYLLFLAIILSCHFSKADHIAGAELTYKYLGSKQYEFTLNIYRDCSGGDVANEYQIDYHSASCGSMNNSFIVKKKSFEEVSQVCPTEPSTCHLGGKSPGIQKYIYKGTATLNNQCSDWIFSWFRQDEYRNNAITNINNPSITSTYIEAKLNNLIAEGNSSPEFQNDPVAFLAIGQEYSTNPLPNEPDGDQLVYKIITPRAKFNASVSYKSPFSAQYPLTSSSGNLTINSTTGSIHVIPTKVETSVISILVEEYRNGQLIGSIVRDMQLIAQDQSNQNPIISGINGGKSKEYEICAGQRICFDISASDPDNQNVKLSASIAGLAGATFSQPEPSLNPKGKFCWSVPVNTTAKDYPFTITAVDENCPIVGLVTETFTIKVNSLPKITLPPSQAISCHESFELKPNISAGSIPYSYLWNTKSTQEVISVGPGRYSLTVTDSKGCVDSSQQISINSSFKVAFSTSLVCGSDEVGFNDMSTTGLGVINKWEWDFGDPESNDNTSTEQYPKHSFTNPGSHLVTLKAEDSEGCKGSFTATVGVCDLPEADFIQLDSCKLKRLTFQDNSDTKNCGITYYQLSVNNVEVYSERFGGPKQRPIYHPGRPEFLTINWTPKDTGWHKVTVTIRNTYNCIDTKTKNIYIHDNPYGIIPQPDYYLDCNNPERLLVVKDTIGGTSPLRLEWSTGSINDSITVDTVGAYSVRIIDTLGCDTIITRNIFDPIFPAASATLFCNENDNILFTDSSFHAWPIVNWNWNFGNGEDKNFPDRANGAKQEYRYPSDGVYDVILTLTDSTGCIDSDTISVNQTLPDTHFVVTPNFICSYDSIRLESPRGQYIDTLLWNLGSKQYVQVDFDSTNTATKNFSKDSIGRYYYNFKHKYPNGLNDTSLIVKLGVYYNMNRDSISCFKEYTDTVHIFKELKLNPVVEGACANDTIFLKSNFQSGSDLLSQKWVVNRHSHDFLKFPNGIEFIGEFPNDTMLFLPGDSTYYISYTTIDKNNCTFTKNLPQLNVITIPKPVVCPENLCTNRQTIFYYTCQIFPEGRIDSVYWDFGDPNSTPEKNKSTSYNPPHSYSKEGYYDVFVRIGNKSKKCVEDTTMTVYISPLPEPDFTSSAPICEGQQVSFFDQSTTPVIGSNIEFMTWVLNDGDTSLARNPVYTYSEAGNYEVKLYVTDSVSQCVDTVSKTIVVHPRPKAGFYYTENELVTLRPIKFYDESIGAVNWLWIWGDGDSTLITNPLNMDPEHTYSAAFPEVVIKQIAINEFECTDTLIKTLDLKIYLLLPNAFSPNGDLNNDGLSLIYKGIDELLEYRIYNRWGELVFDGGTDINAVWDGTYKGKEQPLGTYVYYVKAKDYHQEIITHSGKVTLIR